MDPSTNALLGLVIAGISFWLSTLIVYLFTPVEEKRLELESEQTLDSLRTWSLRAKQTTVLTNAKIYQNGVFRYGKSRRANVIPLNHIDSIQISSGKNHIWLAIAVAAFLQLLFNNGRGTGYSVSALLSSLFWLGIYWISGSRQIIIRAKTTSITVDASIRNMDFLSSLSAGGAGPVSDARVFAFANQIQDLIINEREGSTSPFAKVASTPLPNASSFINCSSCGARLTTGSQFCEECGQPVVAVATT